MWAGGPPKPMQPIRPHSRTITPSEGRSSRPVATGVSAGAGRTAETSQKGERGRRATEAWPPRPAPDCAIAAPAAAKGLDIRTENRWA